MFWLLDDLKLKEPKFDTEGFFRAVFYWPEGSEKRVGERVGMKLTANQQRIIDAIRAAPSTSAREFSTKVGISARKIEQNIAKLKQKGVLRRVGPARGGHWEVVR